jgi:hypothetical protein
MDNDLTQADWLLYTQEQRIRHVLPNVATKMTTVSYKKYLVLSNILEVDMKLLPFITNTDINNSYIHLDSVKIFLNGEPYPVIIHGLNDIIQDNFRKADARAFIDSQTVFYAFSDAIYTSGPAGTRIIGFPNFIDAYTTIVPNAPQTSGHVKTYTIVLSCD